MKREEEREGDRGRERREEDLEDDQLRLLIAVRKKSIQRVYCAFLQQLRAAAGAV